MFTQFTFAFHYNDIVGKLPNLRSSPFPIIDIIQILLLNFLRQKVVSHNYSKCIKIMNKILIKAVQSKWTCSVSAVYRRCTCKYTYEIYTIYNEIFIFIFLFLSSLHIYIYSPGSWSIRTSTWSLYGFNET